MILTRAAGPTTALKLQYLTIEGSHLKKCRKSCQLAPIWYFQPPSIPAIRYAILPLEGSPKWRLTRGLRFLKKLLVESSGHSGARSAGKYSNNSYQHYFRYCTKYPWWVPAGDGWARLCLHWRAADWWLRRWCAERRDEIERAPAPTPADTLCGLVTRWLQGWPLSSKSCYCSAVGAKLGSYWQ